MEVSVRIQRWVKDSEVFFYGDMPQVSFRIQSCGHFTDTKQHMDTLLK
jgi:hypothetical protein